MRTCGCGCQSAASAGWHDRALAALIARSVRPYNQLLGGRKAALLGPLAADPCTKAVLEVGVGTGSNLHFLAAAKRTDLSFTGVDPNPAMLPHLLASAREAGWPEGRLSFQQGVAEALPVPDGSQDLVISTLVLCSVADQHAAVREVKRVLRPGGSFIFMEHVAAPAGSPWVRRAQRLVNPVWRVLAGGCNVTRETWLPIEAGGFSQVHIEHFSASDKLPLALIAPHISGRAVK